MSSTPPDAPSGSAPHEPGHEGPRVTRDEARDLGRIRRSRHDRKVAGVAAGIARHLDIDPLLVRVGFVLLVFFGGAGLLLYGACWLFVPEEETENAVIRVDHGTRTVILAIAGVISLLALLGDSVGDWHFPWPLAVAGIILAIVLASKGKLSARPTSGPFAPPPGTPTDVAGSPRSYGEQVAAQPKEAALREHAEKHGWTYDSYQAGPPAGPVRPRKRGPLLFFFTLALATLLTGVVGTVDLAGADVPAAAYPATVLATCGLMLLVGAFYGRAGGLILVGLLAAAATAITTAADDLSIGEVSRNPTTAAELESRYELGIGRLGLDLRQLDLSSLEGGDRTVDLDIDVGQIEVVVPETGLDVIANTEIGEEGHVELFDQESDTKGSMTSVHDGGPDDTTPQLHINAHADLGEIKIVTKDAP